MYMRPVTIGQEKQAIARLTIETSALQNMSIGQLHHEEQLTILLYARDG
jgi:hypothetical protein